MGRITSRVWELVTHCDTLTKDKIDEVLEKYTRKDDIRGGRGSIIRWAYVKHDKDVYTNEKILEDKPELEGTHKIDHWHIIMQFSYAQDLERLVDWFDIPSNFFEKGRGQGAFEEKCIYLTHESDSQQELGKHLYADNEIYSNFDFRQTITDYTKRKLELLSKYGRSSLSLKDEIRLKVMSEGYSLKRIREEYPLNYAEDLSKLRALRFDYLCSQPPSPIRMNFYIDAKGRVGKDLLSVGIARTWFPELSDEECFFNVGARGVPFEGYDGQPIIIWSDRRAASFISEFGRENVFGGIFNTFPLTKSVQNVKYGSIPLLNMVNIVNGVDNYEDFLSALAGEYTSKDGIRYESEDKNQSYGRFPLIIKVHYTDFDILLNKGYMSGNIDLFQEYEMYENVRGNMRRIAELCNGREELRKELESQLTLPIVNAGKELLALKEEAGKALSDDDIRNQLSFFGTTLSKDELLYEYNNVYLPLFKNVNQDRPNLLPPTFENWLSNGKHNAYEEGRGYFRLDPENRKRE